MTIWRKWADAIQRRVIEADDDQFLECLQVVIERARFEFACPQCGSVQVELDGVNDSDVEHHVYARVRCANCDQHFAQLTHHLLAAAGHAMSSYDKIDLHMEAKAYGVAPGQDSDSDDLRDLDD